MSKLDATIGKAALRVDETTRASPDDKPATPCRLAIPQIYLSLDEQRTLQAGLASLKVTDSASGIRLMPRLGLLLERALDREKIQRLRDFPRARDVAMIVRGLPLDSPLPATPYDLEPGIESVPVLCGAILSVLQTLQTRPVAYEGESHDSVFRHVSPKQKRESEKSSYGSRADLDMHVDNPHLPLTCEPVSHLSACPQYLSLTGLRCELDVPTRIVAIDEALALLPDWVEQALSRPNFNVRRPASFGRQGHVLESVPLLYRSPSGELHCRYNGASVEATCASAQSALQLFAATANHPDLAHPVLLQPGDMLIFKNQQTLHARDGFTPRYDGRDRWMIRVFGVDDPTRVVPVHPHQPYIGRA